MSDVFFKITVSADLQDRKIINWQMAGSFKPKGRTHFYIDTSISAGDWLQLAGPITDDCFYVDPVKRSWNKDRNMFYRIRFKQDDKWVYSTPTQSGFTGSNRELALMKEMTRKQALVNRLGGDPGVFLKRRNWGQLCTACTDFDTREVVDISCPVCFGTGIVGGYFAPIPLTMLCPGTPTNQRGMEPELGTAQVTEDGKRCIAFPFIEKNDLWVNTRTSLRWNIKDVKIAAEFNDLPMFYEITLALIPQTNVVYDQGMKDLSSTPAVESPSGTGNQYGWANGLSCEEDKY